MQQFDAEFVWDCQRWKKHGIDPAARQRHSRLFYQAPILLCGQPLLVTARREGPPSKAASYYCITSTKSIGRIVHRIGFTLVPQPSDEQENK
jgi:hypothetical protein